MSTLRVLGGVDASGLGISIGIENGVQGRPANDSPLLDASGLTVVPGFIDLQINGAFGFDFTSNPASIWSVGERLPSTGVTAFCPTIITAPDGAIDAAHEAITSRPDGYIGAEPIGLHLEGPYLSHARRGTHPSALLKEPGATSLPTDHVAMVTIAPELDGARQLIEWLTSQGIVVSLGHSTATGIQARAAVDAGATMGTHILNAMPPITARDPGLAGVLIADARTWFSAITDGVHLDPATVTLLWRAAPDRFIIITDAIAAAGMSSGTYTIGTVPVTSADGQVRNADGDLAGAVSLMDRSIGVLMDTTGAKLAEAVRTATVNPAEAIGRWDLGRLRRGARGDLTLLDGRTVAGTVIGGVVAHLVEPQRWKAGPVATP